jgi:hypothetical protein
MTHLTTRCIRAQQRSASTDGSRIRAGRAIFLAWGAQATSSGTWCCGCGDMRSDTVWRLAQSAARTRIHGEGCRHCPPFLHGSPRGEPGSQDPGASLAADGDHCGGKEPTVGGRGHCAFQWVIYAAWRYLGSIDCQGSSSSFVSAFGPWRQDGSPKLHDPFGSQCLVRELCCTSAVKAVR